MKSKASFNPESITGHLFILVAPSGAGKSTIINYVLEELPKVHYPISATTRMKRNGEVEGQEYYFLSPEEFRKKIEAGEFLEFANVHGDTFYGTLLSEVIVPLQKGLNVLRHIDYQGIRQIKKIIPRDKVHVIYVDAGSWENLVPRITGRGKISAEELERRRLSYLEEQKFKTEADFIVSNGPGELSRAQKQVVKIIRNQG